MEAIRIIQKRENGHLKLDITLPADVAAEEFEVIVRPLLKAKAPFTPAEVAERQRIAERYKGTMRSDYDPNQYDVYDQ